MTEFYDLSREKWITKKPEEWIRQKWLHYLIKDLGYPKELISLEKGIHTLVQAANTKIPMRRIDIICFAKQAEKESLLPLLTIECKIGKIKESHFRQIMGYNYYIRSRFIAVVNETEAYTLWLDTSTQEYRRIDFIPYFKDLIKS